MYLTILLMAGVTFGTRYLFLHHKLPFVIGPKAQRFLSFSAPAVLTAIWVPIVLLPDGELQLNWHNPYLWGALVAIAVAYKTHNIYATTIAGMVTFYCLM
ncbi:AzlD domain-containing protein [Pseudoalteromonas fenneropenaei]|uniref:AzlD domain-containing protein n=1 Tax=Pseudoalteromonas fenneropenaei TaxID=1737459 RepID=A0ABV7CNQ7_9GAMM